MEKKKIPSQPQYRVFYFDPQDNCCKIEICSSQEKAREWQQRYPQSSLVRYGVAGDIIYGPYELKKDAQVKAAQRESWHLTAWQPEQTLPSAHVPEYYGLVDL